MASGESSSDDCKTDGSEEEEEEEEEYEEPVYKKRNVERKISAPPPHLAGVLRVQKLAPEAVLPTRASEHSAGYDLSSAYEAIVPARGKALVKTELSIAIPEDTYGRVAPRSGLAWKNSIDVGAGVIDYDFRGPVAVILFNHSDIDFHIKEGDRIAQLILEKIVVPEVVEVDSLDSTDKDAGGFRSTAVTEEVEVEVAAADAEVEPNTPEEE